MKRFLSAILLLLFSFQLMQGQVVEKTTYKSQQELYDFYTLKQKRNKTAASILAGSGLALVIVGGIINASDNVDAWFIEGLTLGTVELEKERKGDWLYYAGAVVAVTSIPFVISAGSNKRKARLYLKAVPNTVGNIKFDNSNYMAVGITIPF